MPVQIEELNNALAALNVLKNEEKVNWEQVNLASYRTITALTGAIATVDNVLDALIDQGAKELFDTKPERIRPFISFVGRNYLNAVGGIYEHIHSVLHGRETPTEKFVEGLRDEMMRCFAAKQTGLMDFVHATLLVLDSKDKKLDAVKTVLQSLKGKGTRLEVLAEVLRNA